MNLTPALCSVHTHSTLCDGKNTLAEMAAAACAAGVRYFGVSGHSHTEVDCDQGNVLPADLTEYRAEALGLRREYAGRMEVLLGIEWDSLSPGDPPADLDYWIGSVHHLRSGETGKTYTVDWRREDLTDCCGEMFHGSFPALIEGYYADVAAMAARRPTILGHIDLVTKLNGDGGLFDEASAAYRRTALEALACADPAATLLEINTGAVSRGYRKTPYPAPFLLEAWRRRGGRILLTADTHSAETVVYGYTAAAALAKAAGFDRSVLLTAAGWVDCPL